MKVLTRGVSIAKVLFFRLRKKKVVRDYHKYVTSKKGHALIYYKTDPFAVKYVTDDYLHTNNWEILEMARILNRLGYWVDIVDRSANIDTLKLEDKYDLYIGDGVGRGQYPDIAQQVPSAMRICYATIEETSHRNDAIKKRYKYFMSRHPKSSVQPLRINEEVNIEKAMEFTDAIFFVGNEYSVRSYNRFLKPIYRINLSTSPKLSADMEQLSQRNPQKFLYFAGNGNIMKGLDLTIEAFEGLSDLELYICAPPHEKDFYKEYKETFENSQNIHMVGFVRVGGKKFTELTKECGYIILPSCSEASVTSVLTCMRRGLVPVVTRGADIDIGNFGYLIRDIQVDKLRDQIREIAQTSPKELAKRSVDTYLNSFNYTQARFSESFEKAILNTLITNKKIQTLKST